MSGIDERDGGPATGDVLRYQKREICLYCAYGSLSRILEIVEGAFFPLFSSSYRILPRPDPGHLRLLLTGRNVVVQESVSPLVLG